MMIKRYRRQLTSCVVGGSSNRATTLCCSCVDLVKSHRSSSLILVVVGILATCGFLQRHLRCVNGFVSLRPILSSLSYRNRQPCVVKMLYSDDDESIMDSCEDSVGVENDHDNDDEDLSIDDGLTLEDIKNKFDIDDEDLDDNDDDDDDEDDDDTDVESVMSSSRENELDVSVDTIFQQYQETYLNFKSESRSGTSQLSSSVPKMAIIPSWFHEMKNWNSQQYNQLMQEISQLGSIKDTEAILYHMIQQQQRKQQQNDLGDVVLVNDESFYHVFASYQYRQRQQKKNKNKKNRGIGYKMEQLLAIQDALSNNPELSAVAETARSNVMQPSFQTLNAGLYVMTLDRNDNKIALRAQRIWNRMLQMHQENQMSDDDNSNMNATTLLNNAVLSTLICCTHVPRLTATPADKLSSFTVALECFNWATTNIQTDVAPSPSPSQQQSNIYLYFLRACRILLSETTESKRDAVAEAAFRRACTNGYVNRKVVQAIEEVASDALMLRLLGGFIEDEQELPMEWSRNCILIRTPKATEESVISNDR